jgi:hypothetical protein
LENKRLVRQNARLEHQLNRARKIIEVKKNYLGRTPHLLEEKLGRASTVDGLGRSGRQFFGDS